MPTNSKEYMKEYMKKYNDKNSFDVECPVCGIHLKKCNMYAHKKSKTHILIKTRVEALNQ
jgi:hypothetical protein